MEHKFFKSVVYIVGEARNYITSKETVELLFDNWKEVEQQLFEKHGVHFELLEQDHKDILIQSIIVR